MHTSTTVCIQRSNSTLSILRNNAGGWLNGHYVRNGKMDSKEYSGKYAQYGTGVLIWDSVLIRCRRGYDCRRAAINGLSVNLQIVKSKTHVSNHSHKNKNKTTRLPTKIESGRYPKKRTDDAKVAPERSLRQPHIRDSPKVMIERMRMVREKFGAVFAWRPIVNMLSTTVDVNASHYEIAITTCLEADMHDKAEELLNDMMVRFTKVGVSPHLNEHTTPAQPLTGHQQLLARIRKHREFGITSEDVKNRKQIELKTNFMIMLAEFSQIGLSSACKRVFEMAKEHGMTPDTKMYNYVFRAFLLDEKPECVVDTYKNMVQADVEPDLITCYMMAEAYYLVGQGDKCLILLRELLYKRRNSSKFKPSHTSMNMGDRTADPGGTLQQTRNPTNNLSLSALTAFMHNEKLSQTHTSRHSMNIFPNSNEINTEQDVFNFWMPKIVLLGILGQSPSCDSEGWFNSLHMLGVQLDVSHHHAQCMQYFTHDMPETLGRHVLAYAHRQFVAPKIPKSTPIPIPIPPHAPTSKSSQTSKPKPAQTSCNHTGTRKHTHTNMHIPLRFKTQLPSSVSSPKTRNPSEYQDGVISTPYSPDFMETQARTATARTTHTHTLQQLNDQACDRPIALKFPVSKETWQVASIVDTVHAPVHSTYSSLVDQTSDVSVSLINHKTATSTLAQVHRSTQTTQLTVDDQVHDGCNTVESTLKLPPQSPNTGMAPLTRILLFHPSGAHLTDSRSDFHGLNLVERMYAMAIRSFLPTEDRELDPFQNPTQAWRIFVDYVRPHNFAMDAKTLMCLMRNVDSTNQFHRVIELERYRKKASITPTAEGLNMVVRAFAGLRQWNDVKREILFMDNMALAMSDSTLKLQSDIQHQAWVGKFLDDLLVRFYDTPKRKYLTKILRNASPKFERNYLSGGTVGGVRM
eukprot:CFRG2921T1